MRYCIICPCSSNHKSTCLTWYISRITLESANLQKLKVNPFSTCFSVCLLTVFMPHSFSVMDLAFQTEFHTWLSSLHIGLYRHLTHKEIHIEPKEITCEGFVVFLTGTCCTTGNCGASQLASKAYSHRAKLHLYCLHHETVDTSNFRPPS